MENQNITLQRPLEKKFWIEGEKITLSKVCHESFKSMILCRLYKRYGLGYETRDDFTIESGHLCLPGEELVVPLSYLNIEYFAGTPDRYFLGPLPEKFQGK